MNLRRPLSALILFVLVTCMPVSQAAGNGMLLVTEKNSGVQPMRVNPWRAQAQRRGYMNGNGPARVQVIQAPQPAYAIPVHPIHSRQVEYRGYLQQFGTYYGNHGGVPWWANQQAVPYGPWAIGNGWPNGIW